MEKLKEIISSERNYDKSCSINRISKWTDNIIVETADKFNVDYELAAELLINIGGMYIDEYANK